MQHYHKMHAIWEKLVGKNESVAIRKQLSESVKMAMDASNWKSLDVTVARMWVVKSGSLPKGTKITKANQKRMLENGNTKFRTVRYPKDKNAKDLCSIISKYLEEISLPEQHGFKGGCSIHTAIEPHKNNLTLLEMDGQSAFDTVPYKFVFKVFNTLLMLPRQMARFLADICTVDGFMYQGCPFSPAIYNIYAIPAVSKMAKLNNVTVTTYADDIIISTKFPQISWKFRKFLLKLLDKNGIKINDAKTHFRNIKKGCVKLGLIVSTNRPARKAAFKKKIRLVRYLQSKKIEASRRVNKSGEPIRLAALEKGYLAWLSSRFKNLTRESLVLDNLVEEYTLEDFNPINDILELLETVISNPNNAKYSRKLKESQWKYRDLNWKELWETAYAKTYN